MLGRTAVRFLDEVEERQSDIGAGVPAHLQERARVYLAVPVPGFPRRYRVMGRFGLVTRWTYAADEFVRV